MMRSVEEASQMILFLTEMLSAIKTEVVKEGFSSEEEEIEFFKTIKPQVLGKLIFYNKVYRIETTCPVNNGKMYFNYFENQFNILKTEYKESVCNEDFYRYYRAGRIDRDHIYFRLGNINYYDVLTSEVFEMDAKFSTYYDNRVANIIANELLYTYLVNKMNLTEEHSNMTLINGDANKDMSWTSTHNALIELIYALHASNCISNGNIGIRKTALIFQILFRVKLQDLHHAFHRMKTRSGSRTIFLDQLKQTLEEYMDKDKDS